MGAKIEVDSLCKRFSSPASDKPDLLVLDSVSFAVNTGEFFAVIGPSGCGKTTLINILAGFVPYNAGTVLVDGERVNGPGKDRVVVFQEFALFEWKTVLDNVAFGLKAKGLSKVECKRIAQRYLEMVHLADVSDCYPYELSGGMKQRLALARALAVDPQCILMDEPLGALDYQLRLLMQEELLSLWQDTGKTIVFVTHDVEEAVYLADRIMMLTALPGRVQEIVTTDLARPRVSQLRTSPRCQELKQYLWDHLARPPLSRLDIIGNKPLAGKYTRYSV